MGSSKIGYIFCDNLCNLRVSIIYFQLFMQIQHDLDTNMDDGLNSKFKTFKSQIRVGFFILKINFQN